MNPQHPLYYHCQHDPSCERYGLLQQRSNSFYIIDSNPVILKNVQLAMLKYEFLHFVNVDHFFTFLNKTQKTVDKYQIKSMIESHITHVQKAAVFKNTESRTEEIQKVIDNHNCFLFGMTESTARSMPMDVNHYRLTDNIIRREQKDSLFNDDLQERVFLLRRLLYILTGVFEYVIEFVTLQEKISEFSLERYGKHFAICNPTDTIIPKMVEKELESNQRRIESIKHYYNSIYKSLNEINLDQSAKQILLQFVQDINSEDIIIETMKNYPMFHRTYDIGKIKGILENEANSILKYYE